jgi:hypothetical protein
MFEQDLGKPKEKDNKSVVIISLVLVALLAIGGILVYRSFTNTPKTPPTPGLAGALRTGSADYDEYIKQVVITNQEQFYSENALGGNVITAKGRIQNLGNRMIKGLEVRLVAYDMENKPLAQRIFTPVPKEASEILANGTLPITYSMGNAPEEHMVREIKLEITGLIF